MTSKERDAVYERISKDDKQKNEPTFYPTVTKQ